MWRWQQRRSSLNRRKRKTPATERQEEEWWWTSDHHEGRTRHAGEVCWRRGLSPNSSRRRPLLGLCSDTLRSAPEEEYQVDADQIVDIGIGDTRGSYIGAGPGPSTSTTNSRPSTFPTVRHNTPTYSQQYFQCQVPESQLQ
ncbi:hypothetical protein GWK47_017099 [Chionoecetes opilio]|uniref:Uncharacterized protein n=1 Tax=Chionoecetes opilio TaxID=41210 RepID=A0A8J5CM76_CHIOP|nr:hypothetical protein GWK47_017099 [Chionoecetes opilio]